MNHKYLDAFLKFHHEYPHVYSLFDRFTRDVIKMGHKHYGVEAIKNRIRWHTTVDTGEEEFKVNNNFKVFYGRLWTQQNPEYKDFFRTRKSIVDEMDLVALTKNGVQ